MRKNQSGIWSVILIVVASIVIGLWVIVLFFYFFVITNPQDDRRERKLRSVKANMGILGLGIEQYAGDHNGYYPPGLHDTNSKWGSDLLRPIHNPYDKQMVGVANMEADIKTTVPHGGQVYTVAQTYADRARPGSMRYFIDVKDRSSYAIIGYDQKGIPIKIEYGRKLNYVIHN